MSMIIDGTSGVTFPSGSNPQAAPSKVLQVVQATSVGENTTTSTSFVTANLSASITPLFSTSKIYIMVSGVGFQLTAGVGVYTIYRNSTNLSGVNGFSLISLLGGLDMPLSFSYLDSPATTSSTTYSVYIRSTSGSGTTDFGEGTLTSSITLMEIAQ